nr:hypothetical protein [Tanacetum cinerariifolium]
MLLAFAKMKNEFRENKHHLYGLKHAPRAWFHRFASHITRVRFHHSRCDSSLFICKQETNTAYLLLYVDDIVLTASSKTLLQQIISSLDQEFSMTDLGSLNYFLGISVTRDSSGMFLSQCKFATEILEWAGMVSCNSSRTPVDTESKLGDDGDMVSDLMFYRSEPHFSALKQALRYVCGTMDYGLQLFSSSTTNLVTYSDADCAGCPTNRRSTSGYCVFLGNNLLSWYFKRQSTLSCSIAEAKYRGVANAVAETFAGQVQVLHVPSRYQYADIFTKGLPSALFEEFRTSLSIQCPHAPTDNANLLNSSMVISWPNRDDEPFRLKENNVGLVGLEESYLSALRLS